MIDPGAPACLVLTVGDFTDRMVNWFGRNSQLKRIGIEGEISGLRVFGNGHLGFALKEHQAIIECVAWASDRDAFPAFENGIKVIAYGAVRVHPERGSYKLYVDTIEPTGVGALFLKYERSKKRFRSEGLFDLSRKRAVPELPRRVALVSARGKAVADFYQTIERSVPFVGVIFIETRVQGQGAEIDIAAALDEASKLDVDAIVLTRGGGSYEDLFPFNCEPVVRAIVRAKVPVLTAIAHTEDRHLADEVADRSFGTPSLAAEAIAQGWLSAIRRLADAKRNIERASISGLLRAEQRVDLAQQRLQTAASRGLAVRRQRLVDRSRPLERHNPQRTLGEFRRRLTAGDERLSGLAAKLHARASQRWAQVHDRLERASAAVPAILGRRLERSVAALDRCDPLAPLARGYAIVSSGGRVVRDAAGLRCGDAIEAKLERGMLNARVESVRNDDDA